MVVWCHLRRLPLTLLQPSYSSINRVNGIRAVSINAAADKALIEPSKVVKEVRENVLKQLEQRYPGVTSELEGNTQDEADAMVDLAKGAVLALFCIYALMASPTAVIQSTPDYHECDPFWFGGRSSGPFGAGLEYEHYVGVWVSGAGWGGGKR